MIVDQIKKPQKTLLWKTFTNLAVYVPEIEYILALKLFSGRLQDYPDIKVLAQHLSIDTKEQAWLIVKSYIPDTQLEMRSEHTTKAINRCFTE